ncbi:hypothetical protein LCGC14_2185290 [marine sediment metagenome]|uniref:Uncharacterized protein n=1 Tax=marine sediment metagenome TaxID=412755 RepID=A0A0F9E866_9ZZZZ
MTIPEGYNHKATSEGIQFGRGKAQVYYSKINDDYILLVDSEVYGSFTKSQLGVILHVITDVLDPMTY